MPNYKTFLLLLNGVVLFSSSKGTKQPGKVCMGTYFRGANKYSEDVIYQGATSKYYRDQYKFCTHVVGNLEIFATSNYYDTNYEDYNDDYVDTDEYVSPFQQIEEISGHLVIFNSHYQQLNFQNLRTIEGQSLFRLNPSDDGYALLVAHSYDITLLFPALQEISNGSVGIYTYDNTTCFFKTVNWQNILGGEGAQFHYYQNYDSISEIYTLGSPNPSEEICEGCDTSCLNGCWGAGPKNCVQLSHKNCSAECRSSYCFASAPNECCHSLCSVGCTGPAASECLSCKYIYEFGECRERCSRGRLSYGKICVDQCPINTLLDSEENACLAECPENKVEEDGQCKRLLPGEKKCKQASDWSSVINSGNIEHFRDCSILSGSISITEETFTGNHNFFHNFTFKGKVEPVNSSKLELFGSLRTLTGTLEISGNVSRFFNSTSLSFFRNLEYIGGPKYPLSRDYQSEETNYGLSIEGLDVEILDFRNLKKVIGNVRIDLRNASCFLATVNWGKIADGAKKLPIFTMNQNDLDSCEKRKHVCSGECSKDGCWGPYHEDCVCLNYRQENRCVLSCNKTDGYVSDESNCVRTCPVGKFDEGGICRRCHGNCKSGCSGWSTNLDENGCSECRHSKSIYRNGTVVCMRRGEECPSDNFFLVGSRLNEQEYAADCFQCNKLCLSGCTGPLTILGKSGCNSCYQAVDYGNGTIDCMIQGQFCKPEFYLTFVSLPAKLESNILARKPSCKRCHPLCKQCTDYGLSLTACQKCTHFRMGDTCVEVCPTSFYENRDTGECLQYPSITSPLLIAIASVVGACILLLVIAMLTRKYCYKAQPTSEVPEAETEAVPLSSLVAANLNKFRIVDVKFLRRDKVLGRGAFGKVYRGMWSPEEKRKLKIPVAIKILRGTVGEIASRALVDEAYLMARAEHPHLLQLLALCLSSTETMLVTPLMPLGCLKKYLQTNADRISASTMLTWCVQIARGMEYLENCHIIHRDLAARNVLVERPSSVKITDFGLAKLVGENHEEIREEEESMLPVKWLALECIKTLTFSHKSDVWAFGVTVWEILTFGGDPYDDVSVTDMLPILERGKRLEQPENCSIELRMLLVETSLPSPECRPSFSELIVKLEEMCQDPNRYIVIPEDEFRQLPEYSRELEMQLLYRLATCADQPEELISAADYKRTRCAYREVDSANGVVASA